MKYRKTTAKTAAGVLRAAASTIRRHGWHQGDYDNQATGAVCVFGGLNAAISGQPDAEDYSDGRLKSAVDLLSKRLGGLDIIDWNDVAGRTAEEVLAALEA